MNVTAQKFQSSYALVGKPLARSNHRTTLPQRGSRDGAVPSNRVLAKIRGWRAIFIAPTQLKSFYILPFIGGHSLSHARWA